MIDFRCGKCNKLLAKYTECQELEIKCNRCGMQNIIRQSDTPVLFTVLSNYPYLIPTPRANPIRTTTLPR